MSTRPPPTDFEAWMRSTERRLLSMERRPAITSAADLLGPGIAAAATEVSDWNNDVLGFNGFYFSQPGSINSPDGTAYWMGTSIADTDGSGFQRLTNYRDPTSEGTSTLFPAWPGVTYVRSFYAVDGSSVSWSAWEPERPSWLVASTSDLVLTGTTYTLVPGLTQDVNVRSTLETYAVSANLHIQHNDTSTNNVLARLLVAGSAQAQLIRFGAPGLNNVQATVGQRWVVTGLAAGLTNFQIQARVSAVSNYTIVGGNCSMSVERLT